MSGSKNVRIKISNNLTYAREKNHTNDKYYTRYIARVNKVKKSSSSIVKCVIWIFENDRHLMNHITTKIPKTENQHYDSQAE